MAMYDSNRQKQPELAGRLREIREDLCGEHGAQFLADALKVRVETWLNYESGVTAPAHVVLKLIDIARVNPHWLLTGQGDPHDYRMPRRESGARCFEQYPARIDPRCRSAATGVDVEEPRHPKTHSVWVNAGRGRPASLAPPRESGAARRRTACAGPSTARPGRTKYALVTVPKSPVSHGQEEPVHAGTARPHAHRLLQLGDGGPVVAAAVIGHTERIPVFGGLRPGGDDLLREPHGPGGVAQAGLRTRRQEPRQSIVNGSVVLFQFERLAKRLGRFGLLGRPRKADEPAPCSSRPGCAGVPDPRQSWP